MLNHGDFQNNNVQSVQSDKRNQWENGSLKDIQLFYVTENAGKRLIQIRNEREEYEEDIFPVNNDM